MSLDWIIKLPYAHPIKLIKTHQKVSLITRGCEGNIEYWEH